MILGPYKGWYQLHNNIWEERINLMSVPRQGLGEDNILYPRTWELKAVLRLGFELGMKAQTTVVLRWGGPSKSQAGGSVQLALSHFCGMQSTLGKTATALCTQPLDARLCEAGTYRKL